MQPGFEAIGVAQRSELPPGEDERGLDRVLGQVGVAQDPERDRHAVVADRAGEGVEGLSVAPLSPGPRALGAPDSPSYTVHPEGRITLESPGAVRIVQFRVSRPRQCVH